MKRILHILDSMGVGGIQTFIMNIYRSIDREKIQFDFLLHHRYEKSFDDEIIRLGGKIYYLPSRKEGIEKNKRALDDFFKKHKEYKIVHEHESSLSYIEPLVAAKNNGVPVRIIHSHSTRMPGSLIHIILHYLNSLRLHKVATHYLSCGELAGKWMYGKSSVKGKYDIVYNGIELDKYEFSQYIRETMRAEIGLKGEIVIGHVGRFSKVKNHRFLLDIFKAFHVRHSNSKLVLVGDGELSNNIKNYATEIGISKSIIFLGNRNDVNRVLNAFDIMVMPSLYEGFPIVAIEAQANGLPLYLSNTITKEALIKSNVHAIKLDSSAEYWANSIDINLKRDIDNKILFEKGFDIRNIVKKITELYIKENI